MSKHHLHPFLAVTLVVACQDSSPVQSSTTTGDDPSTSSSSSGATESESTGGDAPTSSTTDTSGNTLSPTTFDWTSESSGGSTDADASGGTTGAPMPCDGACVATPDGWNGPVVLAKAASGPASCEDAIYDQAAVSGYHSVIAPAAECDCSCSVEKDVDCGTMWLQTHDEPECDDVAQVHGIGAGCSEIPALEGDYLSWSSATSGGSCEPAMSMVLPPLALADELAGCTTLVEATGDCDDDTACVPNPADAAPLCWWSDGDVPCPAALDGIREVVYTDAPDDTRGCDACTCAPAEGWCEHPELLVFESDADCNGDAQSLALDECTHLVGKGASVYAADPIPHTSCDAKGPGTPTGGVAPRGPITFCCSA